MIIPAWNWGWVVVGRRGIFLGVEARHSIIVAGDGLAIDDAGRERNLAKDSTIQREAVMSGRCPAGCRAHAIAVLASDYSDGFCLTASAYRWQIAALGLDDVVRPLA
jgi:hypothetical protein